MIRQSAIESSPRVPGRNTQAPGVRLPRTEESNSNCSPRQMPSTGWVQFRNNPVQPMGAVRPFHRVAAPRRRRAGSPARHRGYVSASVVSSPVHDPRRASAKRQRRDIGAATVNDGDGSRQYRCSQACLWCSAVPHPSRRMAWRSARPVALKQDSTM